LPDIFNTDQGSQFTSEEWTGRLAEPGIAIIKKRIVREEGVLLE